MQTSPLNAGFTHATITKKVDGASPALLRQAFLVSRPQLDPLKFTFVSGFNGQVAKTWTLTGATVASYAYGYSDKDSGSEQIDLWFDSARLELSPAFPGPGTFDYTATQPLSPSHPQCRLGGAEPDRDALLNTAAFTVDSFCFGIGRTPVTGPRRDSSTPYFTPFEFVRIPAFHKGSTAGASTALLGYLDAGQPLVKAEFRPDNDLSDVRRAGYTLNRALLTRVEGPATEEEHYEGSHNGMAVHFTQQGRPSVDVMVIPPGPGNS